MTATVEEFEPKELRHDDDADLSKIPDAQFDGRPAVTASSIAAKGSRS